MASPFAPAFVTPYGEQRLDSASYWFVDTSLNQYEAGASDMKEALESLRFVEAAWDPSRNWAMVAFALAPGQDEVIVPNDWGTWYRLPVSTPLERAKVELYGERLSEPKGFFEWIEERSPGILQTSIETAEQVKNAGDFVSSLLLKIGAAGLGVWLLGKWLGRKR